MSPEQQRIKIAETCGYREIHKCLRSLVGFHDDYENGEFPTCIPEYLECLNAMSDAEQTLNTADLQNKYYAEIAEITWGDEETEDRQVVFNQLCASASQRAEAFLKTLNLYVS